MANVLVDDAYVCGGRSNVEFAAASALYASAEIAAAGIPSIRVTTVGLGTSSADPLPDLATIEQPWVLASPASFGLGKWSAFSAV